MSGFAKTAAMMVMGGVVGIGGFAFLTQESSVEAAAPPNVTISVGEQPEAPVEPAEAETAPKEALTITTLATGGVERNRPGAAFAVFDVVSDEDVANVELVVTGAPGTRPQEAIGADFRREGDRLTIELGELGGRERKQVVVALSLSHDSGDFSYHTSYQTLHGTSETVRTTSIDRGVARGHLNHDAYEIVRRRYSEDTIERAERLRDEGEYADALEWVRDAHQANVEVGMAVRLTGELAPYQKDLDRLADELHELMKPKKKAKIRVAKKEEIEVYRLDKRDWRGSGTR